MSSETTRVTKDPKIQSLSKSFRFPSQNQDTQIRKREKEEREGGRGEGEGRKGLEATVIKLQK